MQTFNFWRVIVKFLLLDTFNSLFFCKSNIDDMIGEGWVPGIIPGEYNWKGMNQDPRDRYNIDVVTY